MALEYRGKAKDFGDFLDNTVGKIGYLIGTRGQICTQKMIDARLASTAYQGYWKTLPYAVRWLDKIVVDCYGWYEMFMNRGSLDNDLTVDEFLFEDKRTGDAYTLAKLEKLPNGLIATLPRNIPYPIAVGYTGHVGFFYKGVVYQAAGHKSGTIKTELKDTTHNSAWRYWYYLPWLDYSESGDDMELKKGMGSPENPNEDVRKWQASLIEAGFPMTSVDETIVYGADGSFGGATERATQAFQKDAGLPQSGVVGFATLLAMSAFLATRSAEQKTAITSLESDVASCNVLLANAKSNYDAVNNKLAQIRAIL